MKLRLSIAGGKEATHVTNPFGEVEVTLSRRNLQTLLHDLDAKGSGTAQRLSKVEDDPLNNHAVLVTVRAEENDSHYDEQA